MAEKTTPREQAAASRSRGERSRPPTAAATAQADVVAGRLPKAEWRSLLRAERGDRDASDILAELLARVMDECSKANAARQRVPFAVGQARDALLQMVRQRFPVRDEGETDPEGDGEWREDEEPQPCAADSWAQGSVPVLRTPPSPGEGEVSGARAPHQHGQQDPLAAAEAGGPPARPPHPSRVPSPGALPPMPGLSCLELLPDEATVAPCPPEGKPPRARPPLPRLAPLCPARPLAPCPSPGPAEPLEPPEQGRRPPWSSHRNVEGSGMAGRPEGSGTILGVPRPGPGSRPQCRIRPQVEVLDPGVEAKPPACPQGARRRSRGPELGSLRLPRGLAAAGGTPLQPPPPGSPQPPGPLPRQLGSLLDSARLAPGVTVRRGGSVMHGRCIPAHGEEQEEEEEEEEEAKRDLRPIRPAVPFPAIVARQVTGDGEH